MPVRQTSHNSYSLFGKVIHNLSQSLDIYCMLRARFTEFLAFFPFLE